MSPKEHSDSENSAAEPSTSKTDPSSSSALVGGPEPADPGTGGDDDVTKTTTDKAAADVFLD